MRAPNTDGQAVFAALRSTLLAAAALALAPQLPARAGLGSLGELGALRLRAGDVVQLPALSAPDFYRVLNSRVAVTNADGRSLTALAAGGTGVEWLHIADGATNVTTGAMIVVPEPVGSGKVYLWKEYAGTYTVWSTNTTWECVTDPGYAGYPRNPDDVAMILFTNRTSATLSIGTPADPTNAIGELYVGQLTNVAVSLRLQSSASLTGALNFARSTAAPAVLMLTGGAADSKAFSLSLGGSAESARLAMTAVSDVTLDMGYGGVDSTRQQNAFGTDALTLSLPSNRVLRIVTGHPVSGVNQNARINLNDKTVLAGAGLFWHDSAMNINYWADTSLFSGTFRDSGFGHTSYDRNANIQFRQTEDQNKGYDRSAFAAARATAEVCGFAGPTLNPEAKGGAGFIATGINHGTGSPTSNAFNRLPQHVVLEGGTLYYRSEERTTNTWFGAITNRCDTLTAGKGMSVMWSATRGTIGSSPAYPMNTFDTDRLIQRDRGTLFWFDVRVRDGDTANIRSTVRNFGELAVGVPGTATNSAQYPVIPWAVCRTDNNYPYYPRFLAVDAEGAICKPDATSVALAAAGTNDNAYVYLKSLALSTNVTVNSLVVRNRSSEEPRLGAGRTLTITSGGLILSNNGSAIGVASNATVSGSLVFLRTAYVWACVGSNDMCSVAAKVTATNGLVVSGTGPLILAGDQTGIDGEIAVNSGTLHLGSTNGVDKAVIDADLRIVSRGAKVQVNVPGTLDAVDVKFDDVCGFAGQLVLPPGQAEKCRMLYLGGLEKPLPRGTYGATGSGAEHVDDAHFAGTGVLSVTRDLSRKGTVIQLL